MRGPRLNLAPKLVGSSLAMVVLLAVALAMQASAQLVVIVTAEMASKGEAIALSLAAAAEQSTSGNISMVQGLIDSNKAIAGVRYIYIQDSNKSIEAHTCTPACPAGLEKTNPVGIGELDGKRPVKVAEVDFDGVAGRLEALDVVAPVAGGALGAVHVGMDRTVISRQVARLRASMMLWAAIFSAAALALGLAVAFLSVIGPVRELTRVTGEIVRTGNLAQQIPSFGDDEIGQLAAAFGELVSKMKGILGQLQGSVLSLASSVTNLGRAAAEQSEMITRQAAALQETQTTAQEIRQTSLLASQKADDVLRVAEQAEQIGRAGESTLEQTFASITAARGYVEQMAGKISELGEAMQRIGGITLTVKDLADQSNMLALNAAIEAVRSGEHGRSFAVVAREIRSLADQSIQATDQVREILAGITTAVGGAVRITEAGEAQGETPLSQVRSSGESLPGLLAVVRRNPGAVS